MRHRTAPPAGAPPEPIPPRYAHRPGRAPGGRHRAPRPGWHFDWLKVAAGLVAWLGILVFLYPSAASWFSQYNQSQLIAGYSERVRGGDLDPSSAAQIELAHRYNGALNSGAVLEANERLPTGSGTTENDDLDYWAMLRASPLDVMARLRIRAIDVDLPIYHGTADATLDRGVGHLQGTSLPVGGVGTHSVLTAHRGLANATMFTHLDRVEAGDTFTIEVLGEVLSYRVFDTRVVKPHQTESLRTDPDRDLVTLVTCTPLGINTHRILVTGERITPTPAADVARAGERPDVPGFPWWIVAAGSGTLLAGCYIWASGRARPRGAGGRMAG